MKLSVYCLAFTLISFLHGLSQTRDTLFRFDLRTASTYYRDPGIREQAARFDLGAPAAVRKVSVWLGGRRTGTATVTICGNEGAFPAPLLERPLTRPIAIRKTEPGVQKVEVVLPSDVLVDRPQFFVVVSDLSEGVVLLSDRTEKEPICRDGTNDWYVQSIRGSDGVWRSGRYGFAVEAVVQYPEDISPNVLTDITEDAFPSLGGVSAAGGRGAFPSLGGVSAAGGRGGSPSAEPPTKDHEAAGVSSSGGRGGSPRSATAINRSIAWADVDLDGYADLLYNGRLWLNNRDDTFDEATDRLGDTLASPVHHFLDIENDGDPDILVLALPEEKALLLINDGDGYFTRRELELPAIERPTTVAVADVDSDGLPDVCIGQGRNDSGRVLPGYLLHNRDGSSFDAIPLPSLGGVSAAGGRGALPSLGGVSAAGGRGGSPSAEPPTKDHEAVGVSSSGGRGALPSLGGVSAAGGRGGSPSAEPAIKDLPIVAAQWLDYNNDGHPDLYLAFESAAENRLLLNNGSPEPGSWETVPMGSHGQSAPGDWAHPNAGDLPDLVQPVRLPVAELSDGTIGNLETVREDRPGGAAAMREIPYEGFSGGGTWADLNNDGRLDLLIASDCNCRFASVLERDRSGGLQQKSFEYGLFRAPIGSDAVWLDYNNDGKLDLSTFVDGRFRLLKHTVEETGNALEIDLSGGGASAEAAGGIVKVYPSGGDVLTARVFNGRGALMQGPLRAHFGLGDATEIDSAVVEWAGGRERRVLLKPEANRVLFPFRPDRAERFGAGESGVAVSPNPFSSTLQFRYRLPERGRVRIALHDLSGTPVAVVLDEEREAGTGEVGWRAVDANGSPMPAGTYIWRAEIGGSTHTGRVVLVR